MSCSNPNYMSIHRFETKEEWQLWKDLNYYHPNKINEFSNYKFSDRAGKYLAYKFIPANTLFSKKSFLHVDENKDWSWDVVPIPCGMCTSCRLDYSREWANRCYMESLESKDNYFITLTYDDDHLPIGDKGNATLIKKDFQDFMKRLRKFYKDNFNVDNIRFYACGEYGSQTYRPHYHFIGFNLPIPDLSTIFIDRSKGSIDISIKNQSVSGDLYYYSAIIDKCWSKGHVLVGKANWSTMAYVARYIMKKLKGQSKMAYDVLSIEPEFTLMSRSPGIGQKYFDAHRSEILEKGYILVKRGDKVIPASIPRAFLRKQENWTDDDWILYYQRKIDIECSTSEKLNYIDKTINQLLLSYLYN